MFFLKRFLLLGFLAVSFAAQATYVQPKGIDNSMWKDIQPHLLPEDHPIKSKLDKIFAKGRWIENLKAVEKGDFVYKKHTKWLTIVVAKHAKLSGYVLKFFTDDQTGINEMDKYLRRIWGANMIRNIINNHGLNDLFKVPEKWLYPLADAPEVPGLERKHFVLVVEDMKLVDSEVNYQHWKSSKITHEQLDGLFTILDEGGLFDCVYVDNLPFSTDGRIAFSDTEHFNKPVAFDKLTASFCKSNQKYWRTLIDMKIASTPKQR